MRRCLWGCLHCLGINRRIAPACDCRNRMLVANCVIWHALQRVNYWFPPGETIACLIASPSPWAVWYRRTVALDHAKHRAPGFVSLVRTSAHYPLSKFSERRASVSDGPSTLGSHAPAVVFKPWLERAKGNRTLGVMSQFAIESDGDEGSGPHHLIELCELWRSYRIQLLFNFLVRIVFWGKVGPTSAIIKKHP